MIKSAGAEYLPSGAYKQASTFVGADGHFVALDTTGDNQIKLATNGNNERIIGVVEKGGTVAEGSRIWAMTAGSVLTVKAAGTISRGANITAAAAASPALAGRATTSAANKTRVAWANEAATAANQFIKVTIFGGYEQSA